MVTMLIDRVCLNIEAKAQKIYKKEIEMQFQKFFRKRQQTNTLVKRSEHS